MGREKSLGDRVSGVGFRKPWSAEPGSEAGERFWLEFEIWLEFDLTVDELIEKLGGELVAGDDAAAVTRVADVESAGEDGKRRLARAMVTVRGAEVGLGSMESVGFIGLVGSPGWSDGSGSP